MNLSFKSLMGITVVVVCLLTVNVEARKFYFVNETYPAVPNTVPIRRVKTMTLEEFHKDHTSGEGMPVVLTGLTDDWAARSKWTFDYFKQTFGNETITVQRQDEFAPRQKMKIKDYIEYMFGKKTKKEREHPWYMTNWAFWKEHPEMMKDFTIPKLFSWNLMKYVKPNYLRWVFMGAKGSGSAMHSDTFQSSAWLVTMQGRKRWVMYPPSALDPNAEVDAFYPDKTDKAFAHLQNTPKSGYEAIIGPGEIMYVPPKWFHQVYNIDHTLALTINYIDATNMRWVDEYFKENGNFLGKYEKIVRKQLKKLKKTVGYHKQKTAYAQHLKAGEGVKDEL